VCSVLVITYSISISYKSMWKANNITILCYIGFGAINVFVLKLCVLFKIFFLSVLSPGL